MKNHGFLCSQIGSSWRRDRGEHEKILETTAILLMEEIRRSPVEVGSLSHYLVYIVYTPPETNMTIEKQPFEDVFPIKNGDFPASGIVYWRVIHNEFTMDA